MRTDAEIFMTASYRGSNTDLDSWRPRRPLLEQQRFRATRRLFCRGIPASVKRLLALMGPGTRLKNSSALADIARRARARSDTIRR